MTEQTKKFLVLLKSGAHPSDGKILEKFAIAVAPITGYTKDDVKHAIRNYSFGAYTSIHAVIDLDEVTTVLKLRPKMTLEIVSKDVITSGE